MKVVVYPADRYACGHFRLIWPAEELRRQGHDVTIVTQQERHVEMVIDNDVDRVVQVNVPDEADVVVFQRVTHRYLAQAVSILRAQGIAVVIDVDDDLGSIHPDNPAWTALHPRYNEKHVGKKPHLHSWRHLSEACRDATLVVTATRALAERYGHGHSHVVYNYLPEHYFDVEHEDSDVLGWPASLTSHPNDPAIVGNAVARLIDDGNRFHVTSTADGVATAFGIRSGDGAVSRLERPVSIYDWPDAISKIGVGIAPLADTRFNAAKSWLKPLELSAVGVPWVASPRAEYKRLHYLGWGRAGVLVDKPKDWYRTLRSLLRDDERRVELADAGRSLAAQLRLRDHAWRWWESWELALTTQRAEHASRVG